MTWSKLSAFSLASFEMDAQMGGTQRFADAVTGMEDQISLSPQAMGAIGVVLPPTKMAYPESVIVATDEDEEEYEYEEEEGSEDLY